MPPLPWLSSESDVVSVTSSPSRLRNASFVLFPHPQFGCSYAASLFLNYENYEFITLSDACCRALLEPLLPDARRLHTVWLRGPSAEVEKAAKKTRVVRVWQERGRVEMACEANALVRLPLRVGVGAWGEA